MADLPRCVEWSAVLYRVLMKAYPASFRRAYGDEMMLVFRELTTDAWNRRGWAGLIGAWFRILADLSLSIPQQYDLVEHRKAFLRSTAPMTHKSFRISISESNPELRWTGWRIIAVVITSLLTLIAGAAAFAPTQYAVLCLMARVSGPETTPLDSQTAIVIGSLAGLFAIVSIVWMGARLITRFAGCQPRRTTDKPTA